MTPVTIAQLRDGRTVDLMTAACALGLGRTEAYDLARRQQFPGAGFTSLRLADGLARLRRGWPRRDISRTWVSE